MINEMTCHCIVTGEGFNPHLLIIPESINVQTKIKKGDNVEHGAYRNTPSKEGCLMAYSEIDDMLNFIEWAIKPMVLNCLVELNLLLLVKYETQCNFEIEPRHLDKIASFKTILGITCYEKESL